MRTLLGCPFLALLAVSALGCATAARPGASDDDDDDVPTDAREADARPTDARPVDAPPPIDAPPPMQTITLSQTPNLQVAAGSSIACTEGDGAGGIVATRDNSYYRVFRLADFGINRPFTPTSVSFGIEQAESLAGTQTVQVKLYTLNGGFSLANLTPIAGNNVSLPDSGVSAATVPIAPAPVVQPSATLVVEVFGPDGDPSEIGFGNIFFIGANNATETASGYLRSDACGVAQPTTYATLGFATTRLLLTVTGTY